MIIIIIIIKLSALRPITKVAQVKKGNETQTRCRKKAT
jgi:hypothetical protein